MRGKVVVDNDNDYKNWLAKQKTFAQFASEVKGDAHAGMGLSTARSLAQEVGGDLTFITGEGFQLSLPAGG